MPRPVVEADATAVSRPALLWLGLTTAATAGIIIGGKTLPPWAFWIVLGVAAGSFFLLLRAPAVRCSVVFGVAAALMVLAVAIPPRTSNDVWAYAIYGRIVAEHHASPYVHPPQDYPTDPYFPPAKKGFRDVTSVYGPTFTALSAGVMEAASVHKTLARVLFQGLAALSVLAALVLLWRKTKDAGVLVFAGLNPVVAASVVNGGHNDAMVGLAILGGAYAAPAHPVIAGAILGLGASIKIVGMLPLGAVALWTLYRRGKRAAAALAVSGVAIVAGAYLAAGGTTVLHPLSRAARLITQHSIWYYPRKWVATIIQSADVTRVRALTRAGHALGIVAIAVVIVAAIIVVMARHRVERAEQLAGASLVPYLLGSMYVLPWYPGWVLPSLAPSRRSFLARIAAVDAVMLLAVDPARFDRTHGLWIAVEHGFSRFVIPAFELALLIALVVTGIRSIKAQRRVGSGSPIAPLDDDVSRAAPV